MHEHALAAQPQLRSLYRYASCSLSLSLRPTLAQLPIVAPAPISDIRRRARCDQIPAVVRPYDTAAAWQLNGLATHV